MWSGQNYLADSNFYNGQLNRLMFAQDFYNENKGGDDGVS